MWKMGNPSESGVGYSCSSLSINQLLQNAIFNLTIQILYFIVSRFDWLLELSSVPCSLFACSVASEIGRYSRSLVSKSFIKVYRTELLPEPNGPVMAMFLMFCSSATLKALFKSSTVLYEASFLDSFLGSKVSIWYNSCLFFQKYYYIFLFYELKIWVFNF